MYKNLFGSLSTRSYVANAKLVPCMFRSAPVNFHQFLVAVPPDKLQKTLSFEGIKPLRKVACAASKEYHIPWLTPVLPLEQGNVHDCVSLPMFPVESKA